MTKNFVLLVIVAFSMFSCGNKNKQPMVQTDTTVTDISLDTLEVPADTIVAFTEPEEPEPVHMDELFEDFIYHFATDEKFQKRRTIFPLPYYDEDSPLKIEKDNWEHDSLFYNSSYYTLLADREEDLELVGDTSRNSVQVEWLMQDKRIKRYYFERKSGKWMLEGINLWSLQDEERSDFTEFFFNFATDSLFQSNHLHNPLEFITIDPDDDFAILETTLRPGQWFAFKPDLPAEKMSNINYGQKNEDKSPVKVVQFKGVGNGFHNTLFFRKRNGKWELYKFEDTSN